MINNKTCIILSAAAIALGGFASANSAELPYHGEGHIILSADELEWGDIASMAPPAQMAIIEGDLSKRAAFTFRLKLPADYRIEPHIHPAYERVTVISGKLHFAHGEEFDRSKAESLGPGDVAIMPPGAPMFGYTEEETIIQLHGTGPWGIEYIDPEDDPRN